MDAVITILLGAVGSLIAAELYEIAPRLARWLVLRAASRLRPGERDRWYEEWLADLDEWPGNITKLARSVGHVKASVRLRPLKNKKARMFLAFQLALLRRFPLIWALFFLISMPRIPDGSFRENVNALQEIAIHDRERLIRIFERGLEDLDNR